MRGWEPPLENGSSRISSISQLSQKHLQVASSLMCSSMISVLLPVLVGPAVVQG